jgi:Flp pilus assembly protein TadG
MRHRSATPAQGSNVPQRAAARSQRGQTLPLFVLFMMSLLGMCAMAIDAGTWYQERRHAQSVADAAALAGVGNIPAGNGITAATASFNTNKKTGETATITMPTSDTVKVVVADAAPSFFAKLFKINSAAISATATAQIAALANVFGHVSPYAVLRTNYNNGQGTTLFNANGSGQYGTVDLPDNSNNTGGSCSGSTIMGTSGSVKQVLNDTLPVGPVTLSGCLSPKPGAAQPSATVVNGLAGSLAQDLQQVAGGQYTVIPQAWDDANHLPPRLLYVPIVDSMGNGNTPLTITGFAWFYMTGSSGGGSTLAINGQYVTLGIPLTGATTAYIPGAVGQVTVVRLTS